MRDGETVDRSSSCVVRQHRQQVARETILILIVIGFRLQRQTIREDESFKRMMKLADVC